MLGKRAGKVRSGRLGTRPQTPKKITHRNKLTQSDAEPYLDDNMEQDPTRRPGSGPIVHP
ncbi:predicted protein [Streptomyces viridosporus ATCC 14672]|uniref:Predicted protein n=1 Tax=Streptomyces viridosporus (strain ATCC 14672 / DSM 40746 / JCM 4963 / KCTC 9882 / NRRL B-12104 / FH 1290) TaxID=566461 RepID=D5ZNP9_STRV1|nr:predicted protein [Streptomyces viridosporus ATCC 14672]